MAALADGNGIVSDPVSPLASEATKFQALWQAQIDSPSTW